MKRLHLVSFYALLALIFGFCVPALFSTSAQQVRILVVPHHEIVASVRAEFLDTVPAQLRASVETVVLLSPNHFGAGRAGLQTTRKVWETQGGALEPDRELIDKLVDLGVSIEPDSFTLEHGIYNVVGDIKRTFPGAKIVPLMLKRGVENSELERLTTLLAAHCTRCIYVGSVDFSHDQPTVIAELHDKVSVRTLQTMHVPDLLSKSEVDSPETLAVLARLAQLFKAEWVTYTQTNTGTLMSDTVSPTTSHVFGSYVGGSTPEPVPDFITFAFAGDTMFARGVPNQDGGFMRALDGIGRRLFWGFDISVVNHEGAFSEHVLHAKELQFVSPRTSIQLLKDFGVTHVSLGNNHSSDAGADSHEKSRALLGAGGIGTCGDTSGARVDDVISATRGAFTMVILCVNATGETPRLTERIQTLREKGAFVAVFVHWGIEYDRVHSRAQEVMAQSFIDAGAGLIVGAHPHTVQDVGVYKGVPIIYSLGNFVFDQNFSKEVQTGALLVGSVDAQKLKLALVPVVSGVRPQLMYKSPATIFGARLTPWSGYSQGDWFEFFASGGRDMLPL